MKKFYITILTVAILFICIFAGRSATNSTWSVTTISNFVTTNLAVLSNQLQTNINVQAAEPTNSLPFSTLFSGISTNVAILRPGPVTNTLVFSNGILLHVASTNTP